MPAKAHHYIPAFYLSGFTDPRADTATPYVWVFERGKNGPYTSVPGKAAREKGLYTIEEAPPGEELAIEEKLASLESNAAPLICDICSGRYQKQPTSELALTEFVLCMYLRVPAFLRFAEELAAKGIDPVVRNAYSRGDFDGSGKSLEEVKRIVEASFVPKNAGLFGLAHQMGRKGLRALIHGMKRAFLVAKGEHLFVTGDVPVAACDPRTRGGREVRFSSPDIQVALPLDRGTCLLLTWRGPEGYQDFCDGSVDVFNSRTMSVAQKYLFSPTDADYVRDLVRGAWPEGEAPAGSPRFTG